MVQVVYVDVLFAVNLIINYFIVLGVSSLLHTGEKRLRLFAGAMLGAVYALFIFFPQVGFLYSSLMKVIFSVTIILVSFRLRSLLHFLKLLIVFYSISFLFGGVVFALYLFTSPPGMIVKNGVVYFDISPLTLILCAGGCYILLGLISKAVHKSRRTAPEFEISLEVDGRSTQLKAMLDTGNALTDAITGCSVVIAEYRAVSSLIPGELRECFRKGAAAGSPAVADSDWVRRFRMIPYGSVGRTGGLLPAFRPDKSTLSAASGKKTPADLIVAVSPGKLDADGRYGALIGPAAVEGVRENTKSDQKPESDSQRSFYIHKFRGWWL